jgi:hypothetical protein
MAEYISFDPKSEVRGTTILTIKAGLEALGADPAPFLQARGLNDVAADNWYNLQVVLNMMRDIHDKGGSLFSLISVGNKIPELALWPPAINSVEKAFGALNTAYHMNHRNGEIGSYKAEMIGPRHIRVIAENPWPSDFDYGICWGLLRRFAPKHSSPKVVRAASPCRIKGDDYCIYDVTW